jgi:hypothetical protein
MSMNLRDLSTQTMVVIVSGWLDPERERKDIEALPKAAFLLPTLEEAKADLMTTQTTSASTLPAEIAAVQKEEADIDDQHDRKSRGVYGALTAFAELVDDPNKAAQYIALRDKLFPEGLSVVRWSYMDEAGEADLVEGRLTARDRALLKQLHYPGGKLLDAHEARMTSARKLGDLERKKQALVKAHESNEGKVVAADVLKARNGWIRAVRAFMNMLDLEKNLSAKVRTKILGPLEEAARKAAKRGGNENDAPDAETPEEGAPAKTTG